MSKYLSVLEEMNRPKCETDAFKQKTQNRPRSFFRYRSAANLKYIVGFYEDDGKYNPGEIEDAIFLQPHSRLNDLFDLTIFDKPIGDFDSLGNELIEMFGNDYFESLKPQFTLSEISCIRNAEDRMKAISTMLREKYGEEMPRIFVKSLAETYENLIEMGKKVWNSVLTACFTTDLYNIPMWHFYAGDYSGICFEYAAEDLPTLEPVIYTDELPEYGKVIVSAYASKNPLAVQTYCSACCLHKSAQWSYENEWRLLDAETKTIFEGMPELSPDYQEKMMEFIDIKAKENPDLDISSLDDISMEFMEEFNAFLSDDYHDTMQRQLMRKPDKDKGNRFRKLVKPMRIYLGHKMLLAENRNKRDEIIVAAKKHGIKVLQMQIRTGGYVPFPLEEIELQDRANDLKAKKREIEEKGESGQYDEEMLFLCNEALGLSDIDAQVYNYRGCCFDRMKELDRAERDFTKAIALEPDNYLYHSNLACIFCDMAVAADGANDSLFISAIQEAEAAMELFNGCRNGYITIARAHAYMGRIDDAVNMIEKGFSIWAHDRDYFASKLKGSDGFNELLRMNQAFIDAFKQRFPDYETDA